MKRFSNNGMNNPIGSGYNLPLKQQRKPSQKIVSNNSRLESEIQMRDSFYQNTPLQKREFQKPSELLPRGDTNFLHQKREPVINTQRFDTNVTMRDVTSLTNEKNKVNTMVQEIFEKDKEIQNYKNEIEVCNEKIRTLEAEKQQFKSNEMEVVMLQEKLTEINGIKTNFKELIKQHNELIDYYQESQETIEKLRKVIFKQNAMLNPVYRNDKLRSLLRKYHPELEEETIQSVFESLQITEDMDISKELLQNVMNELRE